MVEGGLELLNSSAVAVSIGGGQGSVDGCKAGFDLVWSWVCVIVAVIGVDGFVRVVGCLS